MWGRLQSLCVLLAIAACGGQASPRPNFVVILCDDLGSGDLGCYGSSEARTPNIDALASDGVRFTQAYATSPACSPSRAGLLVGRHPSRFGHELNLPNKLSGGDDSALYGLPRSETTIADTLREAGYRTSLVGKWHLGVHPDFHPNRRGFDEFYGFLHGSARYRVATNARRAHRLLRNNDPVDAIPGHLTDLLAQEAVRFIEETRGPFFLFLSLKAPHTPIEPTGEDEARLEHVDDEQRRKYLALVTGADRAVGAVVDALDRRGIQDDTIVVFASDHGAHPRKGGSNGALRGAKGSLFEGGIRVPLILEWPNGLPRDATCEEPASLLDLYPTFLRAAGVESPAILEGRDLAAIVHEDPAREPREWLAWRNGLGGALRKGDWKLVTHRREPIGLFDLAADPGESTNLIDSEEARTRELSALFTRWDRKRVTPLWTGGTSSMKRSLGR